MLTQHMISSSSDDQLIDLLCAELNSRLVEVKSIPTFLTIVPKLPRGLRAMAATHQLDVSLALDDLGWHFGNWHSKEYAEETSLGLEVLGAHEVAEIFREAFKIALRYWEELGAEHWSEWYPGSDLEANLEPLNDRAWSLLKPLEVGLLFYWVRYARGNPEEIMAF